MPPCSHPLATNSAERVTVLRCEVAGVEQLVPIARVERLTLRLPTVSRAGGLQVDLDEHAWSVVDTRPPECASLSDHFVLVRHGERRTALVVDRVLDLGDVEALDRGAFAWLEALDNAGPGADHG